VNPLGIFFLIIDGGLVYKNERKTEHYLRRGELENGLGNGQGDKIICAFFRKGTAEGILAIFPCYAYYHVDCHVC